MIITKNKKGCITIKYDIAESTTIIGASREFVTGNGILWGETTDYGRENLRQIYRQIIKE